MANVTFDLVSVAVEEQELLYCVLLQKILDISDGITLGDSQFTAFAVPKSR